MLQNLPAISADLYRIAVNSDIYEFKDNAISLLKEAINFDSGAWGKIAMVDGEFISHERHFFGRPAVMFEALEAHFDKEPFLQSVFREPGKTVTASFKELSSDAQPIRDILDKYDVGYAMGTGMLLPKSGLLHLVVLHRNQKAKPFNETECEFKHTLMPHLVESLRQNVHLQIRRELLKKWEENHCTATSDTWGVLSEAEDRFIDMLLEEWPDWQGAKLPTPIVDCIKSNREWHYVGDRIALHGGPMDSYCLIIASHLGALAALGRRELEIANLFAHGDTSKAIADKLYISNVTVRNHIANIYKKLDINSKTELAKLLSESQGQITLLEHGSS